MAYKGLSDRFNEKASELYGKGSELNSPPDWSVGEEIARDRKRVANFLTSDSGITFLLRQEELQAANTFSETRIINPLAFAQLRPIKWHLQRPISTAVGFRDDIIWSGGPAEQRSPAADNQIGGGGRLQKQSYNDSINRLFGRSGPTGLLNLLPPNTLTRIVSTIKQVAKVGVLRVNERPELNVDGVYFSTLMWIGFQKSPGPEKSFAAAGAALRKGNIFGAIKKLGTGIIKEVKRTVLGQTGNSILANKPDTRNDPSDTSNDGRRYFIINGTERDSYLVDAVVDGKVNLGIMDRVPFGPAPHVSTSSKKVSTSAQAEKTSIQKQAKSKSFLGKIGGFLKGLAGALFGSNTAPGSGNIIKISATKPLSPNDPRFIEENPAEARMLFQKLSLRQRYLDADPGSMAGTFRDAVEYDKEGWLGTLKVLKQEPSYMLGYRGGLDVGTEIENYQQQIRTNVNEVGDVFWFSANEASGKTALPAIIDIPKVSNSNSSQAETLFKNDAKNQIKRATKDTIDFIFYDFVNKRMIPFRAMLSSINETIMPDYSENRYIGRIERNIVYTGITRELSFEFKVQAFSQDELDYVWQKINYLTGLCYPAKYSYGHIVPPFMELTIGKLFNEQPGYIKSLNYVLHDDSTSWEIDGDKQIPMGISISIQYAVVEREQMSTGMLIYGYGQPIIQEVFAPKPKVKGKDILETIRSFDPSQTPLKPPPTQFPTRPTPTPTNVPNGLGGGGTYDDL